MSGALIRNKFRDKHVYTCPVYTEDHPKTQGEEKKSTSQGDRPQRKRKQKHNPANTLISYFFFLEL